jgi:hypothetical protein
VEGVGKDPLATAKNGYGFGSPVKLLVADHEGPVKILGQVVNFESSQVALHRFFPLPRLLPVIAQLGDIKHKFGFEAFVHGKGPRFFNIHDGINEACPGQKYSDPSLLRPKFLEGFFKIELAKLNIEWSLAFPHPI